MFSFSNLFKSNNVIASNASSLNTLAPIKIFSRRSQFINTLSHWQSTPASQYLWVVIFNLPNLLTDANMKQWGEVIRGDNSQWGVDEGIDILHTAEQYPTTITGCLFAQEVTLPSEGSDIEYIGQYNRGFINSPVMQFRRSPQNIRIQMLESNTSFTDSIIRPWLILAAHYGAVARDNNQTIKSNLDVFELAKSGDYTNDLLIRKQWNFTGCIPISVDGSTHTYNPDTMITTRETQWAFTRYQIVNKMKEAVSNVTSLPPTPGIQADFTPSNNTFNNIA